MALISPKKTTEITKVKLEISNTTFTEIQDYCSWAGVADMNHFFEEAAKFILIKDKDWKNYQAEVEQTLKAS